MENKESIVKIFGTEAIEKLAGMKILITGIRGLGVEVAKNIILAGPKSVTLYDRDMVLLSDLGSNPYVGESDIGVQRRDQASMAKLNALNSKVEVDFLLAFGFESLKDYNVVVITEMCPQPNAVSLCDTCRENNVGFIYASALGFSGFTFLDFGDKYMIKDTNGEREHKFVPILNRFYRPYYGDKIPDQTDPSKKEEINFYIEELMRSINSSKKDIVIQN